MLIVSLLKCTRYPIMFTKVLENRRLAFIYFGDKSFDYEQINWLRNRQVEQNITV
jgi:hypothetical protein